MNINALMMVVSEYYDDSFTDSYWCYDDKRFNPDGNGDGLAKFVVIEISETFDPKATTGEQFEEAIRVMQCARNQLNDLIAGLEHAANEEARGSG